jgi:hypothetical protein
MDTSQSGRSSIYTGQRKTQGVRVDIFHEHNGGIESIRTGQGIPCNDFKLHLQMISNLPLGATTDIYLHSIFDGPANEPCGTLIHSLPRKQSLTSRIHVLCY